MAEEMPDFLKKTTAASFPMASEWREYPPMEIEGYQSRVFRKRIEDGILQVFFGREPLGPEGELVWHMSISHNLAGGGPGRIPTWYEIKDARYRFIPDEIHMAMILPPKAEFVNVHETTMHLHQI